MQEFLLPDLGEGMQEAEIRRWLVQPGDTVKRDQTMVEVETDKAVVEIPSPIAGKVAEIRVPAGAVAKLGEVLVVFDTPGGKAPAAAATGTSNGAKAAQETTQMAGVAQSANGSTTKQRVLAAPAVRKRAFELEIDLQQVPTSQPHGRVTMEDLETYIKQRKSAARAAPLPVEPAH